ncbi:DUF6365 family protein [Clostridium sp. BNL1100]|uniref:DUF6365 family protein n=1 Tax=Clostridium sp. BNL1100 TaxID=755731 RepID=UPI00024A7404|nr:DUF6365 family protein [Clostridium sp. BNL1100]AEY67253.1 hypothetical protein Clo1100_3105 [Clostridium sp. BNL1100]
MKKILFVTLGHLSAGEFTIAFEFCKRLPPNKFEICFLTSAKGQNYLEQNRIKHVVLKQTGANSMSEDKLVNKAITDRLMSEFRPDYVIASDVYTLWYSSTWSGVSMETFREYGVPFGSFDSYEFDSTNYVQDYYGGYRATLPDYIRQCDFVIRYCPINKLQPADKKVKFTYFYDRPEGMTKPERIEFESAFRPSGQEKVIFMANSDWENLNVNRLPALSNLLCWCPKMIMHYLAELDEKVTIIHVGPKSWEQESDNKKHIKYFHFNHINPQDFDKYLGASDLFLTTNIISSTLAKAVYASVPSIVLQNDKLVNFSRISEQLLKMPGWYQEMANDVKVAYPYRLFPFGWFNFLTSVLENNEYVDTFISTSIFQKGKTLNALRTYISDKDSRISLQHKQNMYINKILQLPSSADVIDSLENL